jgi:hypothetical protein
VDPTTQIATTGQSSQNEISRCQSARSVNMSLVCRTTGRYYSTPVEGRTGVLERLTRGTIVLQVVGVREIQGQTEGASVLPRTIGT